MREEGIRACGQAFGVGRLQRLPDLLPTAQSQDNEHLLDKTGIQQMDAGGKRYYFDFTSVCARGT